MTKARREFSLEFKREAVALLASSGRPVMQVSAELGISPSMLRTWRTQLSGGVPASKGSSPGPSAMASPADQAAEIVRLKRELDRTRMERDVLKNDHGLRSACARYKHARATLLAGGELPTAYWRLSTPLKNVAHGLLRT